MMADKTGIEWTEATWNPIVGCSVVSPGCTNCYAMRMATRLEAAGVEHYAGTTQPSKAGPVWTGKVALAPEKTLLAPLRWKEPRMIFVNSMGDLFHEGVPDEWIDRVFAVMGLAPQHTFLVLTKRAERMRAYFGEFSLGSDRNMDILAAAQRICIDHRLNLGFSTVIPFPKVWLGVSTEDQTRADERIPDLLATPAAVRFVSAEPLLGPIDLEKIYWNGSTALCVLEKSGSSLDWVIVGGESGPGARPMHPDWARSIRDQCAAAGVPFFFKQWGGSGCLAAMPTKPASCRLRSAFRGADASLTWPASARPALAACLTMLSTTQCRRWRDGWAGVWSGQQARVLIFRKRLPMMHRDGWEGRKANSGMAFACFIWDLAHTGPTELRRIDWTPLRRAEGP